MAVVLDGLVRRRQWKRKYHYSLGEHAQAASGLGKVTTRNASSRLVTYTKLSEEVERQRQLLQCTQLYLEAGQAPIHELNRLLGLDARDSSRSILGDDIAAVEQAAGHVLALTGVALDHLVAGLEAREGHLRDGVLLMVGLVRGEEGRERRDREVDTRETGKGR